MSFQAPESVRVPVFVLHRHTLLLPRELAENPRVCAVVMLPGTLSAPTSDSVIARVNGIFAFAIPEGAVSHVKTLADVREMPNLAAAAALMYLFTDPPVSYKLDPIEMPPDPPSQTPTEPPDPIWMALTVLNQGLTVIPPTPSTLPTTAFPVTLTPPAPPSVWPLGIEMPALVVTRPEKVDAPALSTPAMLAVVRLALAATTFPVNLASAPTTLPENLPSAATTLPVVLTGRLRVPVVKLEALLLKPV